MTLTPLAPLPDDLRPPVQGLTVVVSAEVRRLVRQGGLVPALIASLLAALVIGLGTLPVVARMDAASAATRVGTPVTLAVTAAALVLAVAVALHAGAHTSHGAGPASLVLTPDRHRLYVARLAGVAVLAAAHTGAVALLVGTLAATAADTAAVGLVALGVLGAAVGGALLCVLAAMTGIAVDHPAIAALVLLGWWAVAPITASAMAGFLPRALAGVAEATVVLAPPLLVHDVVDPRALGPMLAALAGLALWTVALGTLGLWLHGRRSLTRRRTSQGF